MNNLVYDFLKGKLANLIESKIKQKIEVTNGGYFEAKTFGFNRIRLKGNYYYEEDGEDHYYLFAYLSSYNTNEFGLPKFHICECETRQNYTGYIFANKMPVTIISRDENKQYENVTLSLCKNCRNEIKHGLWEMFSNLNWYDVVLKKANETSFTQNDLKSDGYVRLWKQISEAYREKNNYKCEECMINLIEDRYFLEVHHIDKNRLNNKEDNLKCLCVVCHSNKHPNNYNHGFNLLKINEFKKKYKI